MQRGWLKSNFAKCPVTINGFWPNQPKHCLSFENPCLTLDQWNQGLKTTHSKNFSGNFNLVFIGRLDASKGMNLILEALEKISLTKVHQIHFIGDSNERSFFEEKASFLKEKAVFHGFLATEKVHQILEDAHFILLPSQSEGFPKVIAEAACYGAISIVSNVGSISHYINETNGFVWQVNGNRGYESVLKMALESNVEKLSQQSKNAVLIAKLFTFENYRIKLEKYILSNNENQI
jgi:glycosyltransferase involved in cell wall biosynthesis